MASQYHRMALIESTPDVEMGIADSDPLYAGSDNV